MVRLLCIGLFMLLGCTQVIYAQDDIAFTASVNRNRASLNDRIQVTFELNSRGNRFRAPDFSNDFKVYSGPHQSTSMAYVNGRMSHSTSFRYLLQPRKTGKITIGPASIQVDGETYQSQPIIITVSNASADQKGSSGQKQAQSIDDIFIRAEVNKTTVYRGEQLFATYKLYSAYPVRGSDRQKLPDLNGFYSSHIDFEQSQPRQEVLNGKRYYVFDLRKYILFPQKSGELQVDDIEFDLTVQVKSDEPIQTFFGPRYRMIDKSITLTSKPITINVKPLPKPQPASFSGAVGKFNFTAGVSPTAVETNESVTLTYKISGSGNINLIDHPTHALPVEFEVYDPKINLSKSQKSNTLSGTKTWEYLMIPRNPGTYTIESPAFSYFDPVKEEYITAAAGKSFTVNVTGEPDAAVPGVSSSKREVEQLDSDIRFIKTDTSGFKDQGATPFQNVFLWLLFLLPALLTALLIFYFRRNQNLRADIIAYRKHRATQVAAKSLSRAKKLLDEGQKNAFFEEVYRALNDYLSNKLTIPRAELNIEAIQNKIGDYENSESLLAEVKEILETCELARFAPVPSDAGPELLQKAESAIKEIENTVK